MESSSYGAYIVSREIMSEQAILGPDVSVYYEEVIVTHGKHCFRCVIINYYWKCLASLVLTLQYQYPGLV